MADFRGGVLWESPVRQGIRSQKEFRREPEKLGTDARFEI